MRTPTAEWRAMRIGINGLLLSSGTSYRRTGVSRYIESLIAELSAEADGDELLVYVDQSLEGVPPGVEARRTSISVQRPLIRIGWELAALPWLSRKDDLDLFHGT